MIATAASARSAPESSRVELFRVLGDVDRLRLLALVAEEELTVGELALLLDESQPQVTKKSQPLRDFGLVKARKEGTRTLLSASLDASDAVVAAAVAEGRALTSKDGSLARVAGVVRAREDHARKFFDAGEAGASSVDGVAALAHGPELAMLGLFAPLLPGHGLAVDVGTGEGALLPLLSPVFDRVIAVDRSPARLARCAERVAALGLHNVRLREGDVDDAGLLEDVRKKGGADVVVLARVLHHAARPQEALAAAAQLLAPAGSLLVVDYLPHDDESMREQGDVWLGFEPPRLQSFVEGAGLEVAALHPFGTRGSHEKALQICCARRKHDGRSH